MSKVLKKYMTNQLERTLDGATGAVFVDLGPMSVERSSLLRNTLLAKAGGARLRVVHNRTAKHALKTLGFPDKTATLLRGPTAMAFGGDGPAAIARTLAEWGRTDKTFVMKGAVAEGEYFDARGAAALARMPDKKTLRGMLASAILGPGRGLAVALSAPGASIARATKARIDEGGFAAEPAGA